MNVAATRTSRGRLEVDDALANEAVLLSAFRITYIVSFRG